MARSPTQDLVRPWWKLLRESPAARLHAMLALLIAVVIPGASWVDGNGTLAWTMFSKSATYRLQASAIRKDGQPVLLRSSQVARANDPWVAFYLQGSDDWRHAPVGRTLRQGLRRIASRVCVFGDLSSVELILHEREHLDASTQTTTAHVDCPP